jgi:hypothetical protein
MASTSRACVVPCCVGRHLRRTTRRKPRMNENRDQARLSSSLEIQYIPYGVYRKYPVGYIGRKRE